MFICAACLGDDPVRFQSKGPCEVCGETKACYDIPSSQLDLNPSSKEHSHA